MSVLIEFRETHLFFKSPLEITLGCTQEIWVNQTENDE